jgi:hypothetical protein
MNCWADPSTVHRRILTEATAATERFVRRGARRR